MPICSWQLEWLHIGEKTLKNSTSFVADLLQNRSFFPQTFKNDKEPATNLQQYFWTVLSFVADVMHS
jgi:hypothetical protein